ncbi:proline--tRNA ligase [Halolactibacillus alkaliphilus]|uniref:Proline--tRNA ligase n=1 Tax=Halolactibacillus alkaliphilus TaxID=442899 RepID=A0A511WYR6_9BACI|nr:proline--tRNA ligase [Halolactibacillus alkaliphilus]GEN55813.1 proline--tRNA ligase [Halolactibacillus alkaliphilus]GGN64832.1 proline--tRNA ligase [Halolactibacillus alkaliphilus]SFO64919.1 prolyl-tRNA synthetase [Halolactibacillus alkaliphilus]
MKQSQTLIPTLKEIPADADVTSHQLLLRAGFIRQNFSGVYTFLPLGKKVLNIVEKVVREEMDAIGGNEVLMPALQSADLWRESGRWDKMGPELMRLNDRHEREFVLGPTHEEVVTSIVRDEVKSYKQLPLTVYQIQTKFRDERRPRFGLLRGREFIMKDAYSFHLTDESLDASYQAMYDAYSRIFTRLGLNFRAVIADSGAMGGKDTHEFMALSKVGEDTIAYSTASDYAANIEMAEVYDNYSPSTETLKELEKVSTPNKKTMQEVADFLGHPIDKGLKTLLFKADESFVLVVTRGDHEVNEIKLKHVLHVENIELATDEAARELLGADFGSLGPIGVSEDVQVICDLAVKAVANVTCGANEDGFHYVNVNPSRDFGEFTYEDIRFIQEGDLSPDGKGTIKFAEGIEIGQVFKLGKFYANQLGAEVLNDQGRAETLTMGCYGIGVSRTLAAIVEQHHDDAGIVWPKQVAPFALHLIVVNSKNDEQVALGNALYEQLQAAGIEVLYDDRKERAGVKFAESDLIGLPVRVTVGKKASEGIIELKERKSEEKEEMTIDALMAYVKTI